MDENLSQAPQPTRSDLAYSTFKGLVSAIPLAGGILAEWFSHFLAPPLEKRRDEWLRALTMGLAELESKVEGLSMESLRQNEDFVSTMMQATQIALRTHQKEKLEALRNALLNIAIGRSPNEDLQTMFLQFVDTLTTWHIRILKFFQDPARYLRDTRFSMGAPSTLLEATFHELRGEREFYDQLVKDLYARGLMTVESLHMTMTESGMYAKRTTLLGDSFIAFITSPI
jgi:hypothetical protein